MIPWPHRLTDRDPFDLGRYLPKLKTTDPGREGQLHYLLRLAVVATDNNIDTGTPYRDENGQSSWGNSTRTKSFHFLVVSENELLAQIALEEEVLYERLEKVLEKIKSGLTTLDEQIRKVSGKDNKTDLSLVSIRVNDVRGKAVLDSASATREVTNDYNRILREMEVNRITASKVTKVREKVCFPLEDIVSPTKGNFARAEDAVQKACQDLEDDVAANRPANPGRHLPALRETQKQLESVRDELNSVLIAMSEGIAESKLLEILLTAERNQRRNTETLRLLFNKEAENILRELLEEPQKK
jgi:hypothetical protein